MATVPERATALATALLGQAPTPAQQTVIIAMCCKHLRVEPETMTATQQAQAVLQCFLAFGQDLHKRLNRPTTLAAAETQLDAAAKAALPGA
jgi:hypothetical protein